MQPQTEIAEPVLISAQPHFPPTTQPTRPMPPVDDRIAANLRTRLQAPNWASDAQLCYELRAWQTGNGLAYNVAASQLGVPHITADVFTSLADFRKPIGARHSWPALMGVHIDREVKAREVKARTPPQIVSNPSVHIDQMSAPTTTSGVDLPALAAAIRSEVGHGRAPRKVKSAKVGAMIVNALGHLPPPAGKRVYHGRVPGIHRLATMLAAVDTSVACDTWHARLIAYAGYVIRHRKAAGATATNATSNTAAVVAQPAPTSGVKTKLIGRPQVRADGKLDVTVQATMAVGPGDALWADALVAVNA